MAKVAGGDRGNLKGERDAQQYRPSWVDRLTAWVARLPGPSWGYYAGLGLALLLAQALVLWIEGPFPIGTFFPVQVFMAGLIGYFLALFGRRLNNGWGIYDVAEGGVRNGGAIAPAYVHLLDDSANEGARFVTFSLTSVFLSILESCSYIRDMRSHTPQGIRVLRELHYKNA